MHQSEIETSLGIQTPAVGLGLWYDAEKLILEGIYSDEMSAYRARRSWIKTFELNFLLEEAHDFRVKVGCDSDDGRYHVQCAFTSACGRYAFWRLTHHQAPEVQFSLETAHLPHLTTVRFTEAEIEPDPEEVPPQVLVDATREEPEEGLLSEIAQTIRRKARKYLRKARSALHGAFNRG
jgi:hypothetical protein